MDDDISIVIGDGVRELLAKNDIEEAEIREIVQCGDFQEVYGNGNRRCKEGITKTGKSIVLECHVIGNQWNVVYAFQR